MGAREQRVSKLAPWKGIKKLQTGHGNRVSIRSGRGLRATPLRNRHLQQTVQAPHPFQC